MGRSELDMVGVQVMQEGWGRVRDGAAVVGEHREHASSSRRGQRQSQTSTKFSTRNLSTTLAAATGPHSSPCGAFWRRRERVCLVARPLVEARRVGVWRMVALWLSLAINGAARAR